MRLIIMKKSQKHLILNWVLLLICSLSLTSSICQEIPDSMFKNSNAIVLKDEKVITHNEINKYVLHHNYQVKILNAKGKSHQSLNFYYKKSSEKIKKIQITVFDENGNVLRKVKSKEIEDFSSTGGFTFISDFRFKHWEYKFADYPITIAYSYIKESRNTHTLPFWNPIPTYNTSVVYSSYTLNSTLPIRVKELNFSDFSTISKRNTSYIMNNQVSVKEEAYIPPWSRTMPIAIICPEQFYFEGVKGKFSTWKEFGKWYHTNFLKNKVSPDKDLIKKDVNLELTGDENDFEIAKMLYDYVQENTRYVSISFDDGGIDPMHPKKVHEVKYGDCKALSLYMKTLLDAHDIPSNYVLVAADSKHQLNLFSDFPSVFSGNHVILNIPLGGDTTWVDCTSHYYPFNFLGSFTDNRTVFEVNENGGALIQTPYYSSDLNSTFDTMLVQLKPNGDLRVSSFKVSHGIKIEEIVPLSGLSQNEMEDYMKEEELADIFFTDLSKVDIRINEDSLQSKRSFECTFSNIIEKAGNYIFIPYSIAKMEIPQLPKDALRKHMIHFPRTYEENHHIIFTTPEPYSIVNDSLYTIESPFGFYKMSLTGKDPKNIIVDRTFKLKKGTYRTTQYGAIKQFLDKCLKSEQSKLILQSL